VRAWAWVRRVRTGSDPGVRGGVTAYLRAYAGVHWDFRPSVSLFSFLPVFPSFFLPSMYSYFIFHLLSLFPHFFLRLILRLLTPHLSTS